MPTKSGIAGMCCGALGYTRGSEKERVFLEAFQEVSMLAISVPKLGLDQKVYAVRRLQDYHTVGAGYNPEDNWERQMICAKAEDGKPKVKNGQALAELTHRQYLLDAAFLVILNGYSPILEQCSESLQNPVWGIWLGRKACVPTAPVFGGLYDTEEVALKTLLNGAALSSFTHQREVALFEDGKDSFMDNATCFGGVNKKRTYAPRRVMLCQARV
jgi:CRISPR system Cascade subunit CasD